MPHLCSGVCLFSCLNPSITSLPMMLLSFCLLLFLSSLCSLSFCHYGFPFFDLHFQSIPSPSHSHLSTLVQINFPSPVSFCVHLSNLITFLSYQSPFSLSTFSHVISLAFSLSQCLCLTPLSFINHCIYFIFISLIFLSDVEPLLPAFR